MLSVLILVDKHSLDLTGVHQLKAIQLQLLENMGMVYQLMSEYILTKKQFLLIPPQHLQFIDKLSEQQLADIIGGSTHKTKEFKQYVKVLAPYLNVHEEELSVAGLKLMITAIALLIDCHASAPSQVAYYQAITNWQLAQIAPAQIVDYVNNSQRLKITPFEAKSLLPAHMEALSGGTNCAFLLQNRLVENEDFLSLSPEAMDKLNQLNRNVLKILIRRVKISTLAEFLMNTRVEVINDQYKNNLPQVGQLIAEINHQPNPLAETRLNYRPL